jgi:hypothetical protein
MPQLVANNYRVTRFCLPNCIILNTQRVNKTGSFSACNCRNAVLGCSEALALGPRPCFPQRTRQPTSWRVRLFCALNPPWGERDVQSVSSCSRTKSFDSCASATRWVENLPNVLCDTCNVRSRATCAAPFLFRYFPHRSSALVCTIGLTSPVRRCILREWTTFGYKR